MMERHIQRRCHDLDEEKMRKSLTKLKADLGISSGGSPPTKHAALLAHEKSNNSPREVKSSSMTSVFSSNVSAVPPPNQPDSALKEALVTTLEKAGKPSDVTDDVSVASLRKSSVASVKTLSKTATPQKNLTPRESVKSTNDGSNKAATTGIMTSSGDVNTKLSATGSDDESEYGSVAALSMALKPGVKLSNMSKRNPSSVESSKKSVKRDESSDIFTNSESTVKEVNPVVAEKNSYSDDDFDDDF